MTRIHVLAGDLVNQIAAGEVVERPSSVVKELVENSLDAGATRVDVEINGGGVRWISVTDNGTGLPRSSARLAFQRHATSKIRSAEDLAGVRTLGFRGEALPSIASIARVRMRTRAHGETVGTELVGEGDGISGVSEVACPEGTRVEIADLFARVPARRKFLKSIATESTHVVRWLERIALAHPEVRFSLSREGRSSLLLLPTRDARERVIAVLSPGLGERLVPVAGEIPFARLTGFASPTDLQRGNTSDIHLYVNKRPVRDRLLLYAVREVYRDALAPGKHPVVALYLDVDPEQVDVNVHPAKWEVRFRQPDAIRRLLRDSLVAALGLGARRYASTLPARGYPLEGVVAESAPADFALASTGEQGSPPFAAVSEAPLVSQPGFEFASLRYLGQALGTFLVFEGPGSLILMDQHAAHERVLFERMRQMLLEGKLERQALLLPVRFELGRSAADVLAGASELMERSGFELEIGEGGLRGGVRVGVRTVPAVLTGRRNTDWRALLEETATALREPEAQESRDGLEGALHQILSTAACHAATRKGDRLGPRDVEGLLQSLDETIWFPNCPHGRPILSVLSEADIERRFLRR
ncbi:MAG: DNA mismatch repair endonuclease MutL [Myxococcales bacterium]|nr:DNA mismatch repair endonuclease MutL [Myxococcales bacterium]